MFDMADDEKWNEDCVNGRSCGCVWGVDCLLSDIFHISVLYLNTWLVTVTLRWIFSYLFSHMNNSFLCYWKVILKAFVIQLCHTDPRDTFRGLNGQSAGAVAGGQHPALATLHPRPGPGLGWTQLGDTSPYTWTGTLHCTATVICS